MMEKTCNNCHHYTTAGCTNLAALAGMVCWDIGQPRLWSARSTSVDSDVKQGCDTCAFKEREGRLPPCNTCVDAEGPPSGWQPIAETNNRATTLLAAAKRHMEDRAATYDKPDGERSMAKTVAAFNAITGQSLSESEGWMFMAVLKMVRDRQRDTAHQDSIEDFIAYASLYGEARLGESAK